MPNHIHGIILIVGAYFQTRPYSAQFDRSLANGGGRAGLEPAPTSLSELMRQLKTFSARRINRWRNTPQQPVWQRNYYEHIIRNEDDLQSIREYILYNPLQWQEDKLYVEA